MLVEGREPGDRADDVGRLVHDDQRRGAEPDFCATRLSKSISTVSQISFGRTASTSRRGSPPSDCPSRRAPRRHALDQLLHRDRHRLFDIARRVHMAGNAEDLGAGVALAADAGEPFRAALQDVGATAMVSTLLTVDGQP
jgi:hypothetical protein